MKEIVKIIDLTDEQVASLTVLNTETTIKQIIDYLVDKLTFERQNIMEGWKLAKKYAAEKYPDFDNDKDNVVIDWSTNKLKIEKYIVR